MSLFGLFFASVSEDLHRSVVKEREREMDEAEILEALKISWYEIISDFEFIEKDISKKNQCFEDAIQKLRSLRSDTFKYLAFLRTTIYEWQTEVEEMRRHNEHEAKDQSEMDSSEVIPRGELQRTREVLDTTFRAAEFSNNKNLAECARCKGTISVLKDLRRELQEKQAELDEMKVQLQTLQAMNGHHDEAKQIDSHRNQQSDTPRLQTGMAPEKPTPIFPKNESPGFSFRLTEDKGSPSSIDPQKLSKHQEIFDVKTIPLLQIKSASPSPKEPSIPSTYTSPGKPIRTPRGPLSNEIQTEKRENEKKETTGSRRHIQGSESSDRSEARSSRKVPNVR